MSKGDSTIRMLDDFFESVSGLTCKSPIVKQPLVETLSNKLGNSSRNHKEKDDNINDHKPTPLSRLSRKLSKHGDHAVKVSPSKRSRSLSDKTSHNRLFLNALSPEQVRSCCMRPLPKSGGAIQCYLVRSSSTIKLFLQTRHRRFLLSAKKRNLAGSLNVMISTNEQHSDRNGRDYMGKVRGNLSKTEYNIFDSGLAPDKSDGVLTTRCQLGAIMYKLKGLAPREVTVLLPRVGTNLRSSHIFRATSECPYPLQRGIESKKRVDDTMTLKSLAPEFDAAAGYYSLDMHGRATMSSVKNMILIEGQKNRSVPILLLGKTGKDTFNVDIRYPLSVFQGFAIVVSALYCRS